MKLTKVLICIITFLTLGILAKKDNNYKEYIKNKLYNESISFSYLEKTYNKYLGSIFPIEENITNNTIPVSNTQLTYTSIENYENGAKLEVGNNYLVQSQIDGIIVYIGEKEKYNSVIIIEDESGINHWYGNICNYSYKLYDHVKKGDILGESADNYIYLVYTKDNTFLDYKDYIE